MDSTQPPIQPADHPYSSSLSEADSLSDSDWLDISSKESDDNDSVSSASDHDEANFGPHSRTSSSLSIGSSRGRVEAWEGFVEDSGDEDVAQEVDIVGISPFDLPPALRNSAVSFHDLDEPNGDILEEQRVKAALDQSMMGTLSSSRTSSGHASTAQNSVRDLRLSFPDPLTSSPDELNTLYEDTTLSDSADDCSVAPIAATSALDPGATITPEVLHITVREDGKYSGDDLEIVMYGAPAAVRWSVVENVMRKAAAGAGLTLSLTSTTGISNHFAPMRIYGDHDVIAAFPKSVTVIDRTSNQASRSQDDNRQSSKPSLAIIFLPARPLVPNTHTSYLPVFVPSDIGASKTLVDRNCIDARYWIMRNIAHGSEFHVGQFPVDVSDYDASRAWDSLQHLMGTAKPVARARARKDNQNYHVRMMGITGSLLALVAFLLVRGYIGDSIQPATRALQTPTSNATQSRISPFVNKSSSPVSTNTAVIPSSLKDYALAVFNPVPLVFSASSPGASSSKSKLDAPTADAVPESKAKAKKPEKAACSEGKLMTWSERVMSSTDLILTSSSLSLEERSKEVLALLTPKSKKAAEKAPEHAPTSLSIRIIDSISQILDGKSLSEVVRQDMKELSDALDQLMIVIGKQTTAIMQDSKGSSKILRERLETRHGRAKARARQLKEMGGELGGQLLSYVEGEIRTRAEQAKSKARDIAETLVLSDAWIAHQKRVDAHRQRMERRGADKEKRKEARRARRQAKRGIFSRA